MLRPRISPCLLVHDGGLVKTIGFEKPTYIGDPINAVRIFNEKEADELIVLDIDATVQSRPPNLALIKKLAAECRMPLCYGGGVTNPEVASEIISLGVEKVALSAAAIADPTLVTRIAREVGRQSVVVVLDVRKKRGFFSKGSEICTHNAKRGYTLDLAETAQLFERVGAGELVINNVDRDGQMQGYDLDLARSVRSAVKLPLTFLGGAGSMQHFSDLFSTCGVVGASAGSFFVYKGKLRGVLISYPTREQKDNLVREVIGEGTI